MGDCSEMEQYIQKNPLENVEFIAVHANKRTNRLNYLNRKGILPYSFYIAFKSWQKQAYQMAKELMQTHHYDLCHMVGPIGYREPGYFWRLGLPYMWGPVGGANNSPWFLVRKLPFMSMMKHIFRTTANTLQMWGSWRVRKALRATDLLLTATSENQKKFRSIFHKDSIYLPENCIDTEICVNEDKYCHPDVLQFIIAGRQDDSKNSMLFLRSLTLVKDKRKLHLDVVGGGPALESMKQYAQKNGLDEMITWHGQLPRYKAVALFKNAHMHVMTSVSEGNPTVIWEAMSYGVPTLSLDHCGMHDTIDDKSGILIPIHNYGQCVSDIAKAIDRISDNPQLLKDLSDGVQERAKQYSWIQREQLILEYYKTAINRHENKEDSTPFF